MEVDSTDLCNGLQVSGTLPPMLPPCKICGNQSTGYHYGANTCEACKAFFRRTLKKTEVNFMCICEGQERKGGSLNGSQKSMCPACRYKRCIDAGMSKDAVKIGRYSHSWRVKNIQEVKRLEQQEKISETTESTHLPFSKSMASSSSPSSSSSLSSPPSISSVSSPPSEPPIKIIMPKLGICTCEVACPVHSLFALSHSNLLDFTENLDPGDMENVIEKLCTEQQRQDEENKQSPEDVKLAQKQYAEQVELNKELFGEMSHLSYEEFADFYQQTGIDIDNRLSVLMEHISLIEQKISDFIRFAKNIPGFTQLPVEDQVNLVKSSRFESSMVAYNFVVDKDLKILTCPDGKKQYHMDEIGKLIDKEFLLAKFELVERINKMKLSLQERSIMRAIVITYSDRCVLKHRNRVNDIQHRLIRCLQHVLLGLYRNPAERLTQIFSLLVSLRHFTDWEAKIMRQIVLDYPVTQNFAIVREVFL